VTLSGRLAFLGRVRVRRGGGPRDESGRFPVTVSQFLGHDLAAGRLLRPSGPGVRSRRHIPVHVVRRTVDSPRRHGNPVSPGHVDHGAVPVPVTRAPAVERRVNTITLNGSRRTACLHLNGNSQKVQKKKNTMHT